ncbi:MAG: type II secretion system protein [Myxococcota bacterium]
MISIRWTPTQKRRLEIGKRLNKHTSRLSGFTLLEVMIALLLVALLMSVAIPTFNSYSGVNLRKSASQLQGVVQDVYNRSALSGETHRLVFDLDKQTFWVEFTPQQFLLPAEKQDQQQLKEAEQKAEEQEKRQKEQKENALLPGTPKRVRFTAIADKLGSPKHFEKGVRIVKVWADHLQEWIAAGQATVTFFPDGYVQKAFVMLEGTAGQLTVVFEPLTGETRIETKEPSIDK